LTKFPLPALAMEVYHATFMALEFLVLSLRASHAFVLPALFRGLASIAALEVALLSERFEVH
jgi:hypothetical protein